MKTRQAGPVPVRPASTLILARTSGRRLEVLMVRRSKALAFAPGFFAFPGGAVDPADRHPFIRRALGLRGLRQTDWPMRVAALREAWEEVGLPGGRRSGDFNRHVRRGRIDLPVRAMEPFARWITPEGQPRRFDTRFFLMGAPSLFRPHPDGNEIVAAEWVRPQDMLRRAEHGDVQIMIPTRAVLGALAPHTSVWSALRWARAETVAPVLPVLERRNGRTVIRLPDGVVEGVPPVRGLVRR